MTSLGNLQFVIHNSRSSKSTRRWLPDRISVGVLTRAFPPDLVDEVIEVTGTRERRLAAAASSG